MDKLVERERSQIEGIIAKHAGVSGKELIDKFVDSVIPNGIINHIRDLKMKCDLAVQLNRK